MGLNLIGPRIGGDRAPCEWMSRRQWHVSVHPSTWDDLLFGLWRDLWAGRDPQGLGAASNPCGALAELGAENCPRDAQSSTLADESVALLKTRLRRHTHISDPIRYEIENTSSPEVTFWQNSVNPNPSRGHYDK